MSELEALFGQIVRDTRESFVQMRYSDELAQIQKKRLEKAIQNQPKLKNQEALLMAEFYALLKQYGYVFSNLDYENLVYLKNQLQATTQPIQPVELGSPNRPSKWDLLHSRNSNKKVIAVDNDVIHGLSRAPKYNSKGAATKDASYYLGEVNAWIDAVEQQEKASERKTLKQLLSTFGRSFIFDQDAFIQALLDLFRASESQKTLNSELDAYRLLLATKLALLTADELKKINKAMNASTMISLGNALYAVSCIGLESVDSAEWEYEAYSDAVKVWKTHQRQMEWHALNSNPTLMNQQHALSDQALKNFGHAALSVHEILTVTRKSVETILNTRQAATPNVRRGTEKYKEVFIFDSNTQMQPVWPVGNTPTQNNQHLGYSPMKITISATENQSIGKLLKAYVSPLSEKKEPLHHAEKQDNAFMNVMTTLNTLFFNPNRFIDLIATLKPESIQPMVMQATNKEIKKLYRSFQSNDVNQLIVLLHRIKTGEADFQQSFCQNLNIPPGSMMTKWKTLQAKTSELCDSIDMLMVVVKDELEKTTIEPLKEYPYKNLLRESSASNESYTAKNSACMKQYLKRYVPGCASFIKKSFMERCYDWIYPADKNVIARMTLDVSPTLDENDVEDVMMSYAQSIHDFSQFQTPRLTPMPEMDE